MATPLGGVDPWIILPRERVRYEEQFKALKPINGIVTGDQAKGFFLQSQLPPAILGQIWGLADTDADGKMNIHEFSIACKLINLKLRGFEIPKILPPSLLQHNQPPAAAVNLIQSVPPLPVQPPLVGSIPVAVSSGMIPTAAVTGVVPPVRPSGIIPPVGSSTMVPPISSTGIIPSVPPTAIITPVSATGGMVAPISSTGLVTGISPGIVPPVAPAAMIPPTGVVAPLVNPSPAHLPSMPTIPSSVVAPTPAIPNTIMGPQPLVNATAVITSQPIITKPSNIGMPVTVPVGTVAATTATPSVLSNGPTVMGQVPPARPPSVSAGTPTSGTPVGSVERVGSLESPISVGSPLQEWAVPHQSKLKYTQLFNTTDRARSGYLSGPQARNIMVQTQLPQPILAQIWALSDTDSDGRLSCEEFVLAMHLCDMAKSGEKLPVVLPPELVPPTFRRQRQGSIPGIQPGVQEAMEGKDGIAGLSNVTFEDKRKENFEKGQAELERRRKALLEIQRKEQEERERKEKEEQEKRERVRQEQERRRQLEFEKQLQRQREAEQEREEQRRRAQEQREAARREMERQRQLEWEKQRLQELQQRRQKEQEKVLQLKAKNQNLGIELSQLNEKVKELSQKISDTRIGVSSVKTTIDGMRTTRDSQMAEMSALKTRLKEQNQRLVALSQEKARLEARNKLNMAADSANQEQVKLAFSNKQITLKQLRDRLQDLQKEIEVKLEDIENNNTQLGDLKQQLSSLIKECEQLYSVYEEKRNKIIEIKGGRMKDSTDFSASWGDSGWNNTQQNDWNDVPPSSWDANVNNSWGTTDTVPSSAAQNGNFMKYRALYEFIARNADELSFQPGDVIMVPMNQNAEPGWLAGELRGHTGWFPESYVELMDSPSGIPSASEGLTDNALAFPPDVVIADSLQAKRQLEGIAEVPENVSDNGSVVEIVGEAGPQVDELASPILGQGQIVENIEAQALYPWRAKKDNHLSFNKGDIIIVKEQQELWWFGESNGAQGWFPKSYVKPVGVVLSETGVSTQEYYVALYPYQSVETGDLSFMQGEVILVIKKEGDWWTGVIGDRQGIFPSNYVQKAQLDNSVPVEPVVVAAATTNIDQVAEEPVVKAAAVAPATSSLPQEQPSEGTPGTPDFAAMSAAASQGKGKKPEIATVLAPYQGTSPEQLSLERGQLIMIRKKTATGWWEGQLQAKGKKRQVGWFPASYVKILSGGNRSTTPVPQKQDEPSQQATQSPQTKLEKVVALYPYSAQNEDELTFEKDDIITLLAKEEESWWRGELNGVSGLFPSNYVAPISPLLDSREQKRQDYICELISTEQAYIEDMIIVHDVFEKPLVSSDVLSVQEISKIFVNWREIIECNYVFLRALRIRRDSSENGVIRMIGDILCENLPRLTAYVRFCSCQLNAASYLQHLTETSASFRDLVKACQNDPRTKGMPLSSFLIKPMQRITKYPLLIGKILENTPEDHPDRQNLQEALYRAEEFCKQVNEGVREKENSDRLEWLQNHIQCEGLEEKLTFNSLTNSVGARKFLHFGMLQKVKSGKELVGFLMNDFLLLAQPSKPISSNHLFSFEKYANINFKMYKKPLFLNGIQLLPVGNSPSIFPSQSVSSSSSDASRLLRLLYTKSGSYYNLLAPSASERNLWNKKLEEAKTDFIENEKCHLQRQQSKKAQFGACGRLLVTVIEAEKLKISGDSGRCDAFCEVSMGSQEHRTQTVSSGSNPKWNASMQFLIKDLQEDVLCITVFDRGYFCPNKFLGRTEIKVIDIWRTTRNSTGPVIKRSPLREVESGEILLKLDLVLFQKYS